MTNRRVIPFLIACALLAVVTSSEAASLRIEWDPAEDGITAGFLLRIGTAPGNYAHVTNVGLVTSYELNGLSEGITYYLALQAYGPTGALSELSAEASGQATGNETTPFLSASMLAGSRVQLTWTSPPNADVRSYEIEVGTAPGRRDLAVIPVAALSVTSPVIPNGTYFIRVRAILATGPGPLSNEVTVQIGSSTTCAGPPGRPSLSAAAERNDVQFSWNPGAGDAPAGYVLDVSTQPDGLSVATIQLGGGTTTLTASAPDATYVFRLAAVNACGASPWSPAAVLTVGTAALEPPGAPMGLTRSVSGRGVMLTWSPPSHGGEVARYRIEVTDTQGNLLFTLDTAGAETSLTQAAVPPGTYVARVHAENEAGLGPPSTPITLVVRP